ncbi:hypothetical protein [Marinicella sp. W31]|uniref:hypothetical protein n=1 Tax=Marinicella sp. W31 TaxID=3023713 RepID=UPI0037583C1B
MGALFTVDNLVSLIDAEMNESFDLGLAQFFSELNINLPKQIEKLEYEMMRYVYEKTQSRSKIQIITGLSRHKIHKFIQNYRINQALERQNPKQKVFTLFITELKELAEKLPNKEIPILGKKDSFNAIFDASAFQNGMITAKTMMESLEKSGCIVIKEKSIRFLSALAKKGVNNPPDLIRQFSDVIYRMSCTQLHNKELENNDKTLYQMTVRSTSIPPEKHLEVTQKIREELRECSKKIIEILEEHEAPTAEERQKIDALNLELGVTQFLFNNERGDT